MAEVPLLAGASRMPPAWAPRDPPLPNNATPHPCPAPFPSIPALEAQLKPVSRQQPHPNKLSNIIISTAHTYTKGQMASV